MRALLDARIGIAAAAIGTIRRVPGRAAESVTISNAGAIGGGRGQLRRGLGVGWIGLVILLTLAGACFGTLPWTFAVVTPPGVPADARYAHGNLELSLLPPIWQPLEPEAQTRLQAAQASGAYVPSRILGTDRAGRDVLARCLAGGAISLTVGLSAALVAVLIGTTYGAYAGYRGGRVDAVLMRLVDILYGLPSILLVVLFAVAVDGRLEAWRSSVEPWQRQAIELVSLLIAIGGVSWLTMARVIRGQVLSVKSQPFIEAARAAGVPPRRQFLNHVLPNLMGPIAVYATLAVPAAILTESFLSFLGIGIRDPLPSWGNLAADGLPELNTVLSRWWLLAAPCILLATSLLALNFLGDALRERFDPARGRT